MPDGSLDLPDELLERLDIVLASLHDDAGQTPEALLSRYAAAAGHPLVNVLTHPPTSSSAAGRDIRSTTTGCSSSPSETGTLLEIDGAASHLDLDGALAQRAAEAGVRAHRRQRLPSRGDDGSLHAVWRGHRAARLGRAGKRRQHATPGGVPGMIDANARQTGR